MRERVKVVRANNATGREKKQGSAAQQQQGSEALAV